MKPPKTGIVSTKNRILAHEREDIPVVVQNASDFMAPRTGMVSTKNRILGHERAFDAYQENQKEQQNTEDMLKNLQALSKAIIVTPTKIIIKQSVLINGLMNADRVYTKRSGNHVELTT